MTRVIITCCIVGYLTVFAKAYSDIYNYGYKTDEDKKGLVKFRVHDSDANFYAETSGNKFESELGNFENAENKVNVRPCRHILYPTYAGTGMERLEDPLHNEKFISTIKNYIRLRRHPDTASVPAISNNQNSGVIQQEVPVPFVHQVQIPSDQSNYPQSSNKLQDFYKPNDQQVLISTYKDQMKTAMDFPKNINDQLPLTRIVSNQEQPNNYFDYSEQVNQQPFHMYSDPAIVYQEPAKTIQDYVSQNFVPQESKIARHYYDTSKQFIVTPSYQDENGNQVYDTNRRQLWVPTYTQYYDIQTEPNDASQNNYETTQQNYPSNYQQYSQGQPLQNVYQETAKQYMQTPQQSYQIKEFTKYYTQPVYKPVIMKNFNQEPLNNQYYNQYYSPVLNEQLTKHSGAAVITSDYDDVAKNQNQHAILIPQLQTKSDIMPFKQDYEEDKEYITEKFVENNDEVVKVEPHLESFINDKELNNEAVSTNNPEELKTNPVKNVHQEKTLEQTDKPMSPFAQMPDPNMPVMNNPKNFGQVMTSEPATTERLQPMQEPSYMANSPLPMYNINNNQYLLSEDKTFTSTQEEKINPAIYPSVPLIGTQSSNIVNQPLVIYQTDYAQSPSNLVGNIRTQSGQVVNSQDQVVESSQQVQETRNIESKPSLFFNENSPEYATSKDPESITSTQVKIIPDVPSNTAPTVAQVSNIASQTSTVYQPLTNEQNIPYKYIEKPNVGKVLQISAKVEKQSQQYTPSKDATESVIESAANVDDLPDVKIEDKLEEIVKTDALGNA